MFDKRDLHKTFFSFFGNEEESEQGGIQQILEIEHVLCEKVRITS